MGSPIQAIMELSYANPELAQRVMESLSPDNEEYIHCHIEGSTIVARVENQNILSMRATMDDFLACLCTAERVIMESSSKNEEENEIEEKGE